MSRLEEIRERLYRKTPDQPERAQREDFVSPAKEKEVKSLWESSALASPTLLERAYLSQWRRRRLGGRTWFTLAALVLIGFAAFIGYTIFFARAPVVFEILGPTQITAGEFTTFTLRIANRGGAALKEGVITLNLPEGSLAAGEADISSGPKREKLEVSDIPAGGEFLKEFRVKFFGAVGQSRNLSALYLYRPENISSKLTRQSEFAAVIVRVPAVVTVDAPEKVNAGQEFSISVSVDAETAGAWPAMALGIDFPAGFELKSSDPEPGPEGGNVWAIAGLESGVSGKVVIRGSLRGEPAEVKPFRIRFGRYDPVSHDWLILTETTAAPAIASPLLLAQAILDGNRQGILQPGARLEGSVFFKNNLEGKIQNLTVTLSFPEQLVELESVGAENGFYDAIQKKLTWNPASEPRLRELDAGEEGVLPFSLTLKSALPIRTFSDKNFSFTVATAIASASPPPEYRGVSLDYRETIDFKMASRLTLAARATYYDSPRPNTGPLPPKVRNTTTYTVFLQLANGANDAREVEVKAEIPGGVEFKEVMRSDVGTVDFNPASRELMWRITKLPAATGILRPQATAVIQLALTPAENQLNTAPFLLRNLIVSGRDVFSGAELSAAAEDLTIELREDSRSNSQEWRVVK